MFWQAIGSVLPSAAAVALSPLPIIAIVVILDGRRPGTRGSGFALGWLLGLVAVMTVVLVLARGADDPDSTSYLVVELLRVATGFAFLALAVSKWRKRPASDGQLPTPSWMATLDSVSPARAVALGAALSGLNPKNLALAATAAASIAEAGLDASGEAIATGVFVVIGASTIVAAVLARMIGGSAAARPLASTKEFMFRHATAVVVVILVVLGAKILGDGLAGLANA